MFSADSGKSRVRISTPKRFKRRCRDRHSVILRRKNNTWGDQLYCFQIIFNNFNWNVVSVQILLQQQKLDVSLILKRRNIREQKHDGFQEYS